MEWMILLMQMSEEKWRAPIPDFKGQIEEKETWNEKKKEGPRNVEANSCTMRDNRVSRCLAWES